MAIRSVFQGGSVKRSSDIAAFEQRLGYEFRNLEILLESLTHPSIASQTRSDNQRLEFLGDRVLGLVMAEALLELDTTAAEGTLAPRFNALVRKETCADVARAIDLGAVLKIRAIRNEIWWPAQRYPVGRCDGGSDCCNLYRCRLWRG